MVAAFRPDGDRPQFIELIERITPVDGNAPSRIDVRLVAADSRPLQRRPWPVCLAD